MVDFRINVIIDSRNAATGANVIEKRLASLQRRAGSLNAAFGRLGGVLAAAFTFRAIQEQIDGYTALQNRLAAVTKEGEDLAKVQKDLLQVSNRSRSSLQEVVRIYSRLSTGAKTLGVSQAELIDFTETLSKTIAISGATSYEAAGALTQFSQAMASGALRGDELRSVLEQLPEVANVIGKRFGVTAPQLAILGKAGRITSDQIIAAFRDAREEIEKRFAKTVPTIAQSFTILKNQILVTFGQIDQATGFSAGFNKAIVLIASNLNFLVEQLKLAALAIDETAGAGGDGFEALSRVIRFLATVAAGVFQGIAQGLKDAAAAIAEITGKSGQLPLFEIREVVAAIVRVFTVLALAKGTVGIVLGIFTKLYAPVAAVALAFKSIVAAMQTALAVGNSLLTVFFNVLAFAQKVWAIIGLYAPTLASVLGVVARLAGSFGAIFVAAQQVFSYLLGTTVTFEDTAEILKETFIQAFVTVRERVSIIFQTLANLITSALSSAIAGIFTGIQKLVGAFQGLIAVGTSLGFVSEETRVAWEDSGNQIEAFLAERTRAGGYQIFSQQELEKQQQDLDKFLSESDKKIQDLFVGIAKRNAEQEGVDVLKAFKDAQAAKLPGAEDVLGGTEDIFGTRGAAPGGRPIAPPAQGITTQQADEYVKVLGALMQIEQVERTRLTLGDEVAAKVEAQLELQEKGVDLQGQLNAARAAGDQQLINEANQRIDLLNQQIEKTRQLQALSDLAAQLDQRKQFNEQEKLLNDLLEKRPDLINEINNKLIDNRIAALESSTAMGDGFERAFLKLGKAAGDYAGAAEQMVMGFADKATDAIYEFVTTGQLNFKEFAVSILQEITKIIIRLLVLKAIEAGLGIATGGTYTAAAVGANAAAGAAGGAGGRAKGGTVQPARSYVVGEKGPEIFVPNRTGTIIPNQQQAAPPQVNVQVVNVEDPKKIPQTISSGGADEAIINVLSRRRDAVKRTLG